MGILNWLLTVQIQFCLSLLVGQFSNWNIWALGDLEFLQFKVLELKFF